MARQGIKRTHTGCVTCKIRKVKCDETRPSCIRCTSTGRRCDGYQIWLPKTLRQIQPSTIPNAGAKDLQSLDYFRDVVGLALPGPLPRTFWTRILPQLSHTELAVRHATIAITSLYGTAEEKEKGAISSQQAKFALKNYNLAISQVIKSPHMSYDVIGVACILFLVVELMDLNEETVQRAWLHYRHGIAFLRADRGYLNIRGIFRQMHVSSSFFFEHFGLPPYDETVLPSPEGPFKNLVDAEESLDGLASRSFKVARALGEERPSGTSHRISDEALLQKEVLDLDLDTWYSTFQYFKSSRPHASSLYLALEARYLICKIWTDPDYYEDCSDSEHGRSNLASAIDFVNAKELPPVMQAMLKSSQNLQVRLAALALFDAKLKYGAHSGKLTEKWEAIFLKCKTEIEQEHGLKVGQRWAELDELENLTGMMMGQNFLDNVYVRTHFLYPWVLQVLNIVDRVGQCDTG